MCRTCTVAAYTKHVYRINGLARHPHVSMHYTQHRLPAAQTVWHKKGIVTCCVAGLIASGTGRITKYTLSCVLQAEMCQDGYNISCEVVDLRTLLPWDVNAVGKLQCFVGLSFASHTYCRWHQHSCCASAHMPLQQLPCVL